MPFTTFLLNVALDDFLEAGTEEEAVRMIRHWPVLQRDEALEYLGKRLSWRRTYPNSSGPSVELLEERLQLLASRRFAIPDDASNEGPIPIITGLERSMPSDPVLQKLYLGGDDISPLLKRIPQDQLPKMAGMLQKLAWSNFLTWANKSTPREKRQFLESHPELVDEQIDIPVDQFLEKGAGEIGENNRRHLRILRDVHTRFEEYRGQMPVDHARRQAILHATINAFGGFSLPMPTWLEEILQGDAELEKKAESEPASGTIQKRVEPWLQAYHRVTQESELEPEILAAVAHQIIILARSMQEVDHPEEVETGLESLQQLLKGYTQKMYPARWAQVRLDLGHTYSSRRHGERAEDIERALEFYEAALQVYTPQEYPYEWSSTQFSIGSAYLVRVRGDRVDNLEEAIKALESALTVQTRDAFKEQWAGIQLSLGMAYRNRLRGDRAENVEHAIDASKAALQIYTQEAQPIEWAAAQDNLGSAYLARVKGDRAENIEEAITALEAALSVYTRESFPASWAGTKNNLGAAYLHRKRGERAENVEQALEAFQCSLEVYTRAAFPVEWAMTQHNLGNALQSRERGDEEENNRQAIGAYEAALTVRTAEAFPLDHRETALSLAMLAYWPLFEQAIQRNDRDMQRNALELAHTNFEKARRIQASLGWVTITPEGRGLLRGMTQFSREMYVRDAWCLWKLGRIRDAVVALEEGRAQALAEFLTISEADLAGLCPVHQQEFLEIRQQLQKSLISEVPGASRQARDKFIRLRQEIHGHCQLDFLPDAVDYEGIRQAVAPNLCLIYLATTTRGGFALMVLPDEPNPMALDLPYLTWHMIDNCLIRRDSDKRITGGYLFAVQYQAVELLQHWVRYNAEEMDLARRVMQPLQALPTMIGDPFDTLRDACEDLINLWREGESKLAESVAPADYQQGQMIRRWLKLSLGEAMADPRNRAALNQALTWFLKQRELELFLNQLGWTCLQPLRKWLDVLGLHGEDQQIALIPSGKLSLLPLNAAWVEDQSTGERVPFQETCELTYQASARSLAAARKALETMPKDGPIMIVADPQPTNAVKLDWAEAEAEMVAMLARRAGRLRGNDAIIGEAATLSRVQRELEEISKGQLGAWVTIATHGHIDPHALDNPTSCYLLLAHNDKLTLAQLQRTRLLAGCREFNAEGCVTGVGDVERAPDEILSLAGGILQAGAAAAVATQWAVSDRATFLLMLRRTQELLSDRSCSPARALRLAARWLRKASQEELVALSKQGRKQLDLLGVEQHRMVDDTLRGTMALPPEYGTERSLMDDLFAQVAIPTVLQATFFPERPYEHPIFWAAFVVYGA